MTDETFFAWLDGELEEGEAARVEALVAADAELLARAARHRALAGRLRLAFEPISAEPVPEPLADRLRGWERPVVDIAGWRAPAAGRRFAGVPQWAAIAASLALGVVVGSLAIGGSERGPVEARGGTLYAAAGLDSALERQLASAGAGSEVRIGLTFRDRSGTICRSFAIPEASGLACRDGSDWRLRGLFAAPEGQGGDYRMAAGQDPRLAELIDSSLDGDGFDSEQERRARENGWR